MILLALAALAQAPEPDPADEATYWTVDHLVAPAGSKLEVGGLGFLSDGTLVASTRRGQVWFVDDALGADPAAARFHLFAEGLHEGLGLAIVDDEVFVLQRGELSRLVDVDGDRVCDDIEAICTGWGLTSNYHEFAFGLPVDENGDFWISLNVGFQNATWWLGESMAPWRGWVCRISRDGTLEPFACGFRSPNGLGFGANGELLVTDNQGDWVPSSPIFHVREGAFYGHPASLDWTEEFRRAGVRASLTSPPARAARDRESAALWIPYKWSRSPGNLVLDESAGRFGPFAGQMFVAELTNGLIVRADFEEVQGRLQGWCSIFRQGIGSACRVQFAPDGALFAGLTNRGWGGLPPADGIARVRWTGVLPFEVERVHLLQDGLEVTFTSALAAELAPDPSAIDLVQYDYDYWWEYGSPERDLRAVPVTSIEVAADRRSLVLRTRDAEQPLEAARMARVVLPEEWRSAEGLPLLHREFAYCINQLPEGPPTRERIVKIVPPPPPKDSDEEGWLRLCWGDAFALWDSAGWALRDITLDPSDTSRLVTSDGYFALVDVAGPEATEFRSKPSFGDGVAHVRFFLPKGGAATLRLMDRYEVLLANGVPDGNLGLESCGAVQAGEHFAGAVPRAQAGYPEGNWQTLDVDFRAPRFDEQGAKTANARIVSAVLNGVTILADVELTGASASGAQREVPQGPLVLTARDGELVALGDLRFRPLLAEPTEAELAAEGWEPLLEDEDSLEGWTTNGEAEWTVDDGEIVGDGRTGHLFSPRGDYANFDLHARVRISDQGNSGLYFRARPDDDVWPDGYEAQINCSFPDPQKTGSLYGISPIATHLVAPETWFDLDVTCRDEEAGTRVIVRVQGAVVVDTIDSERRHGPGHIALQQHHEGSQVMFRDLRIRER